MNEEVLSWIVAFLAGVALVVFFVVPALLALRLVRTRREEFYCPWMQRNVAVRFLTSDGERPIGVLACSAFSDTTGVLCGMPCLATAREVTPSKEQKNHVVDLLSD